jgi:hypothetical protein
MAAGVFLPIPKLRSRCALFFWHLCFALLYYLLKWGCARERLLLLALCDFWEISGFISQSADRTCEGDNCFIL